MKSHPQCPSTIFKPISPYPQVLNTGLLKIRSRVRVLNGPLRRENCFLGISSGVLGATYLLSSSQMVLNWAVHVYLVVRSTMDKFSIRCGFQIMIEYFAHVYPTDPLTHWHWYHFCFHYFAIMVMLLKIMINSIMYFCTYEGLSNIIYLYV